MASRSVAEEYLQSIKAYVLLPIDFDERRIELARLQAEWTALFKKLLSRAHKVEPDTWFAIGRAYSNGWGAAQDRTAARAWFRRAADENHAAAMVSLALELRWGADDAANSESTQCLRRAAELGNQSAMIFLGFAYRDGHGVSVSHEKAKDWFIKAYHLGALHASIQVGRMFAHYLDNPVEAIAWFKCAVTDKQSEAYIQLAMLYSKIGTPVYNPEEAFRWYHAVLENNGSNQARAMFQIAQCYRNGTGISPDSEKAEQWLDRLIESTSTKNAFHREALELKEQMRDEFL